MADVTHFPSFGRLKYVHVTVDTYSGFIHVSPLSGEALCDVITHTLQCMTAMGKPQIIKTDNGPGYTGTKFQQFCSQFDIRHVTGVPYNPQGQGLAERAHHTLKHMLQLLAEVTDTYSPLTPRNRLNHALFVLNFLFLDNEGRSAADRVWHPKSQDSQDGKIPSLDSGKDQILSLFGNKDPLASMTKRMVVQYGYQRD
jgi:transposase InsO family protein